MLKSKKHRPFWSKSLEGFLRRNPDLKIVDGPEKLEYYRQDPNLDLPPMIRDSLLKSLPDPVVQPTTEEHLLEIFRFAREKKIPLTVRGAGTWGYGGAVPTSGGILIDLGSMDTIEVDPEAHQVTVGPGSRFLHLRVLSCFLDHAHRMGWRKFIVYRMEGQRGIGMGMGSGSTFDTTVDVFGSPGEYCGAFNMGALVRVHGHAQNFTGMVMHSGTLEIHGDAGKVTRYSAKGGTFNILGNVVDRGWVCAVSDPQGPGLQVNIVGTAYEHLCQALMGGSVIMLGLFRGYDGILHRMDSPYKGAKILAGASAGEAIFYDPNGRLEEAQYKGCVLQPIDDKKWKEIVDRLRNLEKIFGLGISIENSHLTVCIDGQLQTITPENFRWILPKGELEGYH